MKPEIAELKRQCMAELDRIAMEHPKGHQGAYAARYVIRSENGTQIEVMFEKGSRHAANLWICEAFVKPLLDGAIRQRRSPAAGLNRMNRKRYVGPVVSVEGHFGHAALQLSLQEFGSGAPK